MSRCSAFTLNELAIVIAIVTLSLCLIVAIYSFLIPHRRIHHSFSSSTQIRGIHAGLVLYAQGNNGHYPGVMSDGVTINPSIGLTTQGRVSLLVEDNYISYEYSRSSLEVQTQTTSYALLQVNIHPDGKTIAKDDRNAEWNDTTNNLSVIVSDRAVINSSGFSKLKSISADSGKTPYDWRGHVGWNDNHVSFESTSYLSTKYGTKSHLIDALFASPGDAHSGDDAYMVWSGSNAL